MLDINSRTIPFMNNNDGTRVQLASSQTRQAIALIDPEVPFIRSGYEEQYLHYGSYFYIAKDTGVVLYRDDDLLIIQYDDPDIEGEVIDLGNGVKNYDGFDKSLISDLYKDDRVVKDQILARHSTINEEGFLQLGKNLITTFMSHPFGFKDAIPVSETCAEKMKIKYINSEIIEFTDLIPIMWKDGEISYPQGTYVEKADIIFYTKNRNPLTPSQIVNVGNPIRAKTNGKLYYKFIIDEVVKTKKEEEYYENKYNETLNKQMEISRFISMAFPKNEEKADMYKRYYCPQIYTKRRGKCIILMYWIVSEIPIIPGCKLSNRHGNKGVCSIIVPDKEMPMLKSSGQYADIIISPLSVTSRMNVGQLFENHLNNASHRILEQAKNMKTLDERKDLIMKFLSYIQEDEINKIFEKSFNEKLWNRIVKDNGIQIIERPFHGCTYDDLIKACKFSGMDDDLKDEVLFNGKEYRSTFGWNYWYRLEHEPYKKTWGRSVGEYSSLGQPCRGTKAHRLGEMESWALSAYPASDNITEFFVTKSDNLSEAARAMKYLHDGSESIYAPHDKSTGVLRIFKDFLNAASYNFKYYNDADENN